MEAITPDNPSLLDTSPDVWVAGTPHRRAWLWIALITASIVALGHGASVDSGLWLDDHAHYQHLKESDWSFQAAVDNSRLGIMGEVMDLWTQNEGELRFFRPVSFWTMKLGYTIVGWQPWGMHVISLCWHFGCAMLVGVLAMRCFGRPIWAAVAAGIVALHPGHLATVYWVACQTELMTTFYQVLGVLAYARFAGWGDGWFVRSSADGACVQQERRAGDYVYGVIAILCYMLALGCRENAVMFPALCWIGDRLLGPPGRGWLRGWVRVEYVVTALVVVGYFVLRSTMLDGFRLPQRPYLIPPTDPDFLPHVLEKIVYYTIGMFGYLPVIPVGGQAYLAERVFGLYGSFALLVILFLCIWWGYGFRKAWLWPLAWFLCTMLPVLPVFASGHHLYLPGVGGVLMLTAGLALAGGLVPFGRVGEPRHRPWVTGGLIAVHVVVLGFITWVWGFTYVRGPMSEDMLIEDVVERGPELKSGDQLFFINLPPLAFYAVTAIEDQTGVDDLQGHALSFATQLTRMEKASEVEIVDEHTIVLRPPAGELYYEGITGRSMLEAMGFFELPEQGVPIEAGLYTVTPTLVEEDAIGELTYRFKKRIDSPDYHFYLGSPYFLAYPLDIRLGDESVASGP